MGAPRRVHFWDRYAKSTSMIWGCKLRKKNRKWLPAAEARGMSSNGLQGKKLQFLHVKILSSDQIRIFCICTNNTTTKTAGGTYTHEHLAFRGLIVLFCCPRRSQRYLVFTWFKQTAMGEPHHSVSASHLESLQGVRHSSPYIQQPATSHSNIPGPLMFFSH